MCPRKPGLRIILLIGGIFLAIPTGAHADTCSASAVVYWEGVTDSYIGSLNVTGPATESRRYAIVSLAMHNALNTIDARYAAYPYPAGVSPDSADPATSAEAAAAGAADEAIAKLFALSGPPLNDLTDRVQERRACDPSNDATWGAGFAFGKSVADKVMAMRASDNVPGSNNGYVPPAPGPGVFDRDPPNAISMPHIGEPSPPAGNGGQPFVIQDRMQFAPPPPLALGSSEYADDYNEVQTIGGTTGARSDDQELIAAFWFEPAPRTWNRIARAVAASSHLDDWDAARLFSLMNMAFVDATITTFAAKYGHSFWRPKTAIRQLVFDDGNPATEADASWTPLYQSILLPAAPATDPYAGYRNLNRPEYPALQTAMASAAHELLAAQFGEVTVPFVVSSSTGVDRTFSRFEDAAREATDATVYLGAHFRTSAVHGTNLGRAVARWTLTHALLPAGTHHHH